MLKRHKRELHAKLAHWMSGLAGARAGDFLGLTAEHYERAGDAANAAEFHARAANHARARYAHEAVLHHVERGLALLGDAADAPAAQHAALRWRLHDAREHTFGTLGRRSEQQADLKAMQALADRLDDDAKRAEIERRSAFLGMRLGEPLMQEQAARRAMALFDKLQDHAGRLRAVRLVATALCDQGLPAEARALAEQGLAEARERGLRSVEAQFLNALYSIAEVEGDAIAGLRANLADLLLCQALGERLSEAVVLCNVGESWLELGDLAQARRYLDDSLVLLRGVGERTVESSALSDLAELVVWQRDAALAQAHAQAALAIAQAVQAPDYVVKAWLVLGDAELALGQHQAAAAAFEQALALSIERGYATRHDAAAGAVRVALAVGDGSTAAAFAAPLLLHVDEGGRFVGAARPRRVQLACAEVLARSADPRAAVLLAAAHAELMARAAAIEDTAIRDDFLNQVPENRALQAALAKKATEP